MERRQFIAGTVTGITVSLAGCGILGGGPEGVTKEYLNALADGNTDKQDELTHDDAGYVPTDSDEEVDLTINEVSKESAEDVADERDQDEDDIEESAEDVVDEVDADDFAYVYYDIESDDGGDSEGYIFLLKDDGWKIYSFAYA